MIDQDTTRCVIGESELQNQIDSWLFDVDEANALLDEAGWTYNGDFRGKDGVPLVANFLFISTGREQRELIAQIIQEQAQ